MLRRLKQQVSEAVNAVNERAGGDSSSMGSNEEKEGFVCPQCMNVFPTPDELSNHFLTHTQEPTSPAPMRVDNPNFDAVSLGGRRRSELDSSLPPERQLEELQSQLKEEKWYSAELKKELERINSVIAQSNHVPEEEVPYLMQQIQVLEAGKSMVTQRLMELEKEGMGWKRKLEQEKVEKGEIMKKLKELTGKIREVTDENEKEKVEKEQLSTELSILRNSAQKLERELVNLNQMLQERPSEDDVLVLKNELINAQKLMDEITKEKEVELSEQQNSIRMLSQEREKQHLHIQNLEKQLTESGSSSIEQRALVSSLSSSVESERAEWKKKMEEMEGKVGEQNKTIDTLRRDLSSALDSKGRLEEGMERNTREAEILNETNQSRLEELDGKMKMLVSDKKRLEGDLAAIEERAAVQNDSIRALEQSNLDLTNEVSSLNLLLEKEKEKLNGKKSEVAEREKELRETKEKMEEERREREKIKSEFDSMAATVEGLQRENGIARENANLLRSQISDGESGMKTLMDQLNEEKERLAKDILVMGEALKAEKEQSSTKLGEMEKKMREMENEREKEEKKKKEEMEGLMERLNEGEEEIGRKTDRICEMEREMEEEKRKGVERLGILKEAIERATSERDEERGKREEASRLATRLEKEVKEKERQVGESRGRIEDALKRVTDAEEKARRLEEELSASSASLASTSESEQEERRKGEEERRRSEELKQDLLSAREEIDGLKEEVEKTKKEMEEREKHWKAKLAEKEGVIRGNEKMNEELIEKEKEREKELEKRRKEGEEREKHLSSLKEQLEEESAKIGEMEKEREEKKKEMEMLQESLVLISGEKEELERGIKEMREGGEESKERITTLEEELKDAIIRLDSTIEIGLAREKIIEEGEKRREEEEKRAGEERERIEGALMQEKEARLRVEEELKEKNEEIGGFMERVSGFESESASLRREVERLEKEVEGKEEERREGERRVEEVEKKKRELEERLGGIEKEKEEGERKVEELSNKLISMESTLSEQKEEVVTLRKEIEERRAEVEVEIHRNQEREEERAKREEEWKAEGEKLRRSLEGAISDRGEMEKKWREASEGMELLTVKNMELVQASAAFDEEKSALIERCLNTESDLDFERERALENKHRFDEAISAMHELGRANQSLQMDMNKMTGRKWLDDSAVINCSHCNKLFSLTVRKHHCRVCGNIFCGTCSNKTIRIASHKNPVRVCDHCHSEVDNR